MPAAHLRPTAVVWPLERPSWRPSAWPRLHL